jgi:hypothetical protein
MPDLSASVPEDSHGRLRIMTEDGQEHVVAGWLTVNPDRTMRFQSDDGSTNCDVHQMANFVPD